MSPLPDRAVSVALHEDRILVIRRHRSGEDYCVLPGGGVEHGESPRDASLRELREETGLTGAVERHLWTFEHADRVAHYFLVGVEPGPMVLGGPEATSQSLDNRYAPDWVRLAEIDEHDLRPTELREHLRRLSRPGT